MKVTLLVDRVSPITDLCAITGSYDWGEVETVCVADTSPFESDVVFSFAFSAGEASESANKSTELAHVTFVDSRHAFEISGISSPSRIIAVAGEQLWRRAPLPIADPLFDLPLPSADQIALIGSDTSLVEEARQKLTARNVIASASPTLTAELIRTASVIAFVEHPHRPIDPLSFAPLAARRLLIAPYSDPGFGLIADADYLGYNNIDELVCAVDSAISFPCSYDAISAMGRVSAAAQRASIVYPRLASDVLRELELFGDTGSLTLEHVET